MEDNLKSASGRPRAIAILGMHRSGTSTVARAVNLLGVPLGRREEMMPATPDNSEGYWEHLGINTLQIRLLTALQRGWGTAEPLPENWQQSPVVPPFKTELKKIVAAEFAGEKLWGWKDPRSCLLLPLWREILAEADTDLSCLFVVRSPVDVAGSLMRRDGIPFPHALGIWFHHNIAALRDAAGLPLVFLNYEKLVAAWEPEMRRCAAGLNLAWPADEAAHRAAMGAFIKPELRRNRSSADQLEKLPAPVRELYRLMLDACETPQAGGEKFAATVARLAREFQDYATFFSPTLIGATFDTPHEEMHRRLSQNLDGCLSQIAGGGKPTGRELVTAWRENQQAQFEFFTVRGKNRAPKFFQKILGERTYRSLCKRVAELFCWLHP
jgi:hypothetical protein